MGVGGESEACGDIGEKKKEEVISRRSRWPAARGHDQWVEL